MAYNTPETVADYLARFQMEITHRGKGTFTPDHVKYSLTIANGGKDFSTTFESNPHVHGEPTITQVFGALASDAMVVRDYGMDEFVDEFCDGMKPSAAIRAYNSCKETYDWSPSTRCSRTGTSSPLMAVSPLGRLKAMTLRR